jgi:hypothetical protein
MLSAGSFVSALVQSFGWLLAPLPPQATVFCGAPRSDVSSWVGSGEESADGSCAGQARAPPRTC